MRVMRCVTNKKIRGEDEDERMEHATDGFSVLTYITNKIIKYQLIERVY